MIIGIVTRSVWITKRVAGVPAGAFLEVKPEVGAPFVAFDVLGTGAGETVLIVTGSAASSWLHLMQPALSGAPPIDALVIGPVDGSSLSLNPDSVGA